MTPQQLRAWRDRHGLSRAKAGEALGISKETIDLYELGYRRDNGKPVIIPKAIALACAAIDAGILEYVEP